MAQLFDSAQYGWKDLKAYTGGRGVTGIHGFKIGVTKELEYGRGEGENPHSIQEGNKGYPVELKVTQSEFEAMIRAGQKAVPNGDHTDVEWDFTLNFSRKVTDKMSTHRAVGVKFSGGDLEMGQGDKQAIVTLAGLALRLEWNV